MNASHHLLSDADLAFEIARHSDAIGRARTEEYRNWWDDRLKDLLEEADARDEANLRHALTLSGKQYRMVARGRVPWDRIRAIAEWVLIVGVMVAIGYGIAWVVTQP